MARTKVEHFVSILNLHNETNFFKRFTVQMTSTQLDALLAELENSVQIPETIPRAVSLVGKNTTPENEEIWVLKPDLFIDARGHLVAPRDHSLCWIGNLVKDTGNNIAKKDRVADVHLPLTTYYFDLACHFLRGDMLSAVSKDDNLEHCLDEVLHDCEIPQESLEDEAEANGNFLPTFFTAAMSLIIAHYDKVSKNNRCITYFCVLVTSLPFKGLARQPTVDKLGGSSLYTTGKDWSSCYCFHIGDY